MTRSYIKSEYYRLSDERRDAIQCEIAAWHVFGLRWVDIAEQMQLPYSTVVTWARDMGLKRNSRRKPNALKPKPTVESLPGESWKPVVGFERRYLVSDLGRVRSLATGKLVSRKPDPRGYVWCGLVEGSRRDCRSVHSMVLEAFVGPRPKGCIVRHLDGTRDNKLSNLAWGTHAQNAEDRLVHALW